MHGYKSNLRDLPDHFNRESWRFDAAPPVVGNYVSLKPRITRDPTLANELHILQSLCARSNDANAHSIILNGEDSLFRR